MDKDDLITAGWSVVITAAVILLVYVIASTLSDVWYWK